MNKPYTDEFCRPRRVPSNGDDANSAIGGAKLYSAASIAAVLERDSSLRQALEAAVARQIEALEQIESQKEDERKHHE